MNIPQGHQAVMPYLMLRGALKFIKFVETVFDAKLNTAMHRLHDDCTSVMHSEISIADSTIMVTDATEQWPPQPANLFVYVNDADAAYRLAIDNGATTVMELSDKDYGRTCGVTDPFGNVWWITSISKK